MGGTESKETIVQSTEGEEAGAPPAGYFGVTVTGELVEKVQEVDKSVEEAMLRKYEDGRVEGIRSQQDVIASVAFQTYDSAHQELRGIQDSHLKGTKEWVSKVEQRLTSPQPIARACADEQLNIQKCLETNKSGVLACHAAVKAYSTCAFQSNE